MAMGYGGPEPEVVVGEEKFTSVEILNISHLLVSLCI